MSDKWWEEDTAVSPQEVQSAVGTEQLAVRDDKAGTKKDEGNWWEEDRAFRANHGPQAVLSIIEAEKKRLEDQAKLHEANQSLEKYGEIPAVASQIVTDTAAVGERLLGMGDRADEVIRDSAILDQAMRERDAARWRSEEDPEGMSALEQAGQYIPWLKQGVRGAARSLGTAVLGSKGAGAFGAIGLASAQETNRAITEGKDAGLEGSSLAGYAASQGVIEALPATVMQRLGLGGVEAMIAGPSIRGGIKAGILETIKRTGQEIPEELITEIGHAVATEYSGLDPSALSGENLSSLVADTVLQTVLMGAGAGAMKTVEGAVQGAAASKSLATLDKPPGAHKWAEIVLGDRKRFKEAPDEKTRTEQWQQSRGTATQSPLTQGVLDGSQVQPDERVDEVPGDAGQGSQVQGSSQVRIDGQDQGGTQQASQEPATPEVQVDDGKPISWKKVKDRHPSGYIANVQSKLREIVGEKDDITGSIALPVENGSEGYMLGNVLYRPDGTAAYLTGDWTVNFDREGNVVNKVKTERKEISDEEARDEVNRRALESLDKQIESGPPPTVPDIVFGKKVGDRPLSEGEKTAWIQDKKDKRQRVVERMQVVAPATEVAKPPVPPAQQVEPSHWVKRKGGDGIKALYESGEFKIYEGDDGVFTASETRPNGREYGLLPEWDSLEEAQSYVDSQKSKPKLTQAEVDERNTRVSKERDISNLEYALKDNPDVNAINTVKRYGIDPSDKDAIAKQIERLKSPSPSTAGPSEGTIGSPTVSPDAPVTPETSMGEAAGERSSEARAEDTEYEIKEANYDGKTQFLFRTDGKEVGEIAVVQRDDGNFEVSNVLVWPQSQRQGHASKFYQHAAQFAESKGKSLFISSDVTEDAKKLHEAMKVKGVLGKDGRISQATTRSIVPAGIQDESSESSAAEIASRTGASKWHSETRAKLEAVPALKGAKVEPDEKAGAVKVTRPDGLSTTIHFNADEELAKAAKEKLRNPESIYGRYVREPGAKEGKIYLRSDADHTNILNHEVMHWLEDEGVVTKEEVEKYGGREEIATKYGKWAALKQRKKDSVFQRIYDVLEPVFSSQRRFFDEVGKRQAAEKLRSELESVSPNRRQDLPNLPPNLTSEGKPEPTGEQDTGTSRGQSGEQVGNKPDTEPIPQQQEASSPAATAKQDELEEDQLPPEAIEHMLQGDRLKGEMWRSPAVGGRAGNYGAFYATNEEGAGKYSRGIGVNVVVADMVELNNPLVVQTKSQAMEELGIDEESLAEPTDAQDIHHYIDIAIFEAATEEGYDGVIYKEEGYAGNPIEVHVFSPPDVGELPAFTVQGKQPTDTATQPEPAPGSISLDEFADIFANPEKLTAPKKPRSVKKDAPPSKPKSKGKKKTPSEGVQEGLKEAKEGADLILKGLKDLGSTPFSGPPINADIARGMGMMANGLIKAGKYKFAEFIDEAVKMIGAPAVRYLGPYLEAGWNKKAESDNRLDKAGKVSDILTSKASDYGTLESPNRVALGKHFQQQLESGKDYKSIVEARKEAATLIAGEDANIEPGTPAAKAIDEAVEQGVVRAARSIAESGSDPLKVYDSLLDLYERQPRLNVRTGTSMRQQAYSTPAPAAWIASILSDTSRDNTAYDSSAGNGMLLLGVDAENAIANELNPERAQALRELGYQVNEGDATKYTPEQQPDRIIINPPFGELEGQSWTIDGTTTDKIDHAIVLKTLESLPEDGKAVLIIGSKGFEQRQPKDELRRGEAYKNDKNFYNALYDGYNVTDHFTLHGDMYSKQGAAFPIDVIVIDGRGKSELPKPYQIDRQNAIPRVINSWKELRDVGERYLDTGTGRPSGLSTEPVENDMGDLSSLLEGQGKRDVQKGGKSSGDTGVGGSISSRGGSQPQESGGDSGQPSIPGSPGKQGTGKPKRLPSDDKSGASTGSNQRDDAGGLDRVADVDDQETGFQTAYKQRSGSRNVGTLVPTTHVRAVQDALDKAEDRYGNLDEFVAGELGYSIPELEKYFSAEQVDALALTIARHKEGKAFVLGDQTGVGKGRVAAATMVYAKRQGLVPVFVTQSSDLYSDMYRDLQDIGQHSENEPFYALATNTLMGKDKLELPDGTTMQQSSDFSKDTFNDVAASVVRGDGPVAMIVIEKTTDAEGKPLGKTPKGRQRVRKVKEQREYDAVFTAYSQMQTVAGETKDRHAAMSLIAPNAFFVLDESHNAGGVNDGGGAAHGGADEGPVGRAARLRSLVSEAQGVLFLSATYAKNPGVMDLYAKTGMGDAIQGSDEALIETIIKGGLPLQQVLSEMLVESGTYMRREKSFKGIGFSAKVEQTGEAEADEVAGIFNAINELDGIKNEIVKSKAFKRWLTAQGLGLGKDSATGRRGMDSSTFSSIVHNLVDQMLLSIKADAVADEAIATLKRGESPIIGLSNTAGAALGNYLENFPAEVGEDIEFGFNSTTSRYLERSREIMLTDVDATGKKTSRRVRLPDEVLGEDGVAAYNAAKALIEGFAADIPASPIDHIRNRIEEAGYKVAEITGRSMMVDYSEGKMRLARRPSEEQGKAGKLASVRKYNSGEIDALILNQSGSTGLSAHASDKFVNQKRRHMIIAQADRNIDTFMQMLGRINRTGQVEQHKGKEKGSNLPHYTLLMTNVPAEIRPSSVLMKKLASLNANVTADSKGSVSFDAPDILNKVGDRVVAEYIADNPALNHALGDIVEVNADGAPRVVPDIARKVSGRMAMRPIPEQKAFWDSVTETYAEEIEQLNKLGKNPLAATKMDLGARTLERVEIFAGDTTADSPFLQPAYADRVRVKKQGEPMTPDEIKSTIAEFYGSEPDQRTIREWSTKQGEIATEAIEAKAEQQVTRLVNDEAIGRVRSRASAIQSTIRRRLNSVAPGMAVEVSEVQDEGRYSDAVSGIVIDVKAKKGKEHLPSGWIATIALSSPDRVVRVPFSRIETAGNSQPGDVYVAPSFEIASDRMYESWEEAGDVYEERIIGTGNVLAAFDQLVSDASRGNIVFFTDEQGVSQRGVLMPRSFNLNRWAEKRPATFATPQQVLDFISIDPGHQANDPNFAIQFTLDGTTMNVRSPRSRQKAGRYTTNQELIAASGTDFVSVGQILQMKVRGKKQQLAVIEAAQKLGPIIAANYKEDARAIVGAPGVGRDTGDQTEADFGKDVGKSLGITASVPLAGPHRGMGLSVRHFFQRFFTSQGELPADVYDAKIRKEGRVAKEMNRLRNRATDLRRGIKKALDGKQLTQADIERMNAVLRGEKPLTTVPAAVRAPLKAMRDHIDSLSSHLILEGVAQGDLVGLITENMGVYATRSYRVFDNPKWRDQVPDAVRNRAVAAIRALNPDKSDAEVAGILESLLFRGAADSPVALLKGSKLGSKDLSTFIARKDIPEWLRELWGEYKDAGVNYARSVFKMAHLLANQQFLNEVRDAGLGKWLRTDEDGPIINEYGEVITPIAAESSSVMEPLNGLLTTPEIKKAFERFDAPGAMPEWLRVMMTVNYAVKYGKTVGSVMTHVRNTVSNVGFAVANGHWRLDKAGKAVWGTATGTFQLSNEKFREYYNRLAELGIVGEDVRAGELKDALRDASEADIDEFLYNREARHAKKAVAAGRAGVRFINSLYQAEDGVWKIYAWENEKARYAKAHPEWSQQQVEEHAAKIVRNTYPTYSKIPEAIKTLRRFPLVGTFVSFPSEVVRTTFHTVALGVEEMQSKETRAIGTQRLAGTVVSIGMLSVLSRSMMAMFGIGDDDDEDLRWFVPPWQENSRFVYLNKPQDATFHFVDLGYSDPHAYLTDSVVAFMRGGDWKESLGKATAEFMRPFASEEILAKALMDLRSNEGDKIYNPKDEVGEQAKDIVAHLWTNALEPGTLSSGRRIITAIGGTDPSKSVRDEVLAVTTGQRIQKVDVEHSLGFRVRDFGKALTQIQGIARKTITSRGTATGTTVTTDLARMEKLRLAAFAEMQQIAGAARRLGVPEESLRTILTAELPDDVAEQLMTGDYSSYEMTPQTVRQMMGAKPDEFMQRFTAWHGQRTPEAIQSYVGQRLLNIDKNTDMGRIKNELDLLGIALPQAKKALIDEWQKPDKDGEINSVKDAKGNLKESVAIRLRALTRLYAE